MIWLSEQVTLANGEEHVVVGSLDLNQGLKILPGEKAGIKSEMESSFLARTSSLGLSTPSRSVQVNNTLLFSSCFVQLAYAV